MIQFRCRCSHEFSVPDEEAGTSLQCPSCGLLVDVPTLQDLATMGEGGAFEIGLAPDPDEAPDDPRAARSGTLDYEAKPPRRKSIAERTPSFGEVRATDRRMSLEDFLKVGSRDADDEGVLELAEKPDAPKTVARPRYDPVTGELIRPMDVTEAKAPAPLLAQPAALSYERRNERPRLGIGFPFREMFAAPNLIVNAIVTAMCYAAAVLAVFSAALFLPAPFLLGFILISISHFANTIDETGPTGTDELPTPLRGVSVYDDVIRPLFQVMVTLLIAFLPLMLLNRYVVRLPWMVDLGLLAVSFLAVPAVLLTMTTSGAANNLLPTRMFSVVTAAGWHYWVVTAVGFAALLAFCVAFTFGLSSGDVFVRRLIYGPPAPPTLIPGMPLAGELLLTPLLMFAAVYLIHVFCWQMGLLYRLHHDRFNWVLQKHDKSERDDVIAQLQRHRASQREAEAAALAQQQRSGGRVVFTAAPRRGAGQSRDLIERSLRERPKSNPPVNTPSADESLVAQPPVAEPIVAKPKVAPPIARPAP